VESELGGEGEFVGFCIRYGCVAGGDEFGEKGKGGCEMQ